MKIFDSSPLIAILGELNQPKLLSYTISLGYSLYVPFTVVEEVTNSPEKENLQNMINDKQITKLEPLSEEEIQIFRNRFYRLGRGESELILIAQQWQIKNKNFCCIIDDNVARKVGEGFNLKCKGTIGILRKLKERGLVSPQDIEVLFKRLEECGFRYKFK